jgi:HAD superfamily hydrolase (TIGR01509 family)
MPASERALIFDVDGTLVDSNDAHAAAWARALGEAGIHRDVATIRPLIGMGGDKLLPRVAGVSAESELGRTISRRRFEIFREVYLPRLAPFRGARDLFERLRADGVRLAIANSAKKEELFALLDVARVRDLVDPDKVTSADDVDASKPDPDSVAIALHRLGTAPGATLMVGDTPYDIDAARRAGLETIAVRCGGWKDRDLSGAYAIFDDPADLLRAYLAHQWTWPALIRSA